MCVFPFMCCRWIATLTTVRKTVISHSHHVILAVGMRWGPKIWITKNMFCNCGKLYISVTNEIPKGFWGKYIPAWCASKCQTQNLSIYLNGGKHYYEVLSLMIKYYQFYCIQHSLIVMCMRDLHLYVSCSQIPINETPMTM